MTTVLVSGGAGFIGSALVRHLIAHSDYFVVNLDKLTYAGNLESLGFALDHARHHFVHTDIVNETAVRTAFQKYRPVAVVHLAAESHVDRSIDSPAQFISTNIVGTFTLLQEARRHWQTLSSEAASRFRFLHVSTDEVYGSLGSTGRFDNATAYDPSSPYSASKAAADHLVRAWYRTFELPTIVTNCSNNYGPYQFPEKLIPLTILNALEGRPLPVYGKGENVRDWLYVDDHVRALHLALERGEPGDTYLIGGDAERRNLDVVRAVCRILDDLLPDQKNGARERLITFVEDRPGHDLRYAIDADAARLRLQWAPEENFESGLRKTVNWYVDNRAWADRVQSGAYSRERLGLDRTTA